jgi:glutamine phosphoribosylpyrophosphate amidotransferase
MARDAGARKVYLASAAPPVRYPNVYGIDMPTKGELVAHDRTIEQIRELIGADALIYQDVDAMKRAIGSLNPARRLRRLVLRRRLRHRRHRHRRHLAHERQPPAHRRDRRRFFARLALPNLSE